MVEGGSDCHSVLGFPGGSSLSPWVTGAVAALGSQPESIWLDLGLSKPLLAWEQALLAPDPLEARAGESRTRSPEPQPLGFPRLLIVSWTPCQA